MSETKITPIPNLTYFGPPVEALSDDDVTSVLRSIRFLEELERMADQEAKADNQTSLVE